MPNTTHSSTLNTSTDSAPQFRSTYKTSMAQVFDAALAQLCNGDDKQIKQIAKKGNAAAKDCMIILGAFGSCLSSDDRALSLEPHELATVMQSLSEISYLCSSIEEMYLIGGSSDE